jgi:mannose-1-phosphate guanylyltransferase/mannose-1-phosphate guanylyltransferase/mannose-6-phosphate isomerase
MNSPKPYREERPWGEELWISTEKPSMVKILSINPHEELSLQFHHNRDEFWHVISGDGIAQIGEEKISLQTNSECFVRREMHHRLVGGNEKLVILELAFGDFDEKDITRLEDKYGRT